MDQTQNQIQVTKINYSPLRSILIAILIMLAAAAIIVTSSLITLRITNNNSPIIDAAIEVKYELSLFHLWLEELVQQDPTVDKEQVWQHLNRARWYANAMLEGGKSPEGRFQALNDPTLRSMIRKQLDLIDKLEVIGLERLAEARSNLAGSDKDQEFDKFFSQVLNTADVVETAVQQHMAKLVRRFERLIYILGALVILVGLTGGITIYLFEQRRKSDYALFLASQEQLEREQTLLAEAQRVAHIGNWELNLFTNELWWSDEVFAIFEIDPEQFSATYKGFLDAIHPEDREEVNRAYNESVRERNPYDLVHRLLMSDGRIKFAQQRCETSYDEAGIPMRSIGTVQDITDRHQTSAALRKSEQRLALLLNTIPHGIQENDTEGIITYSNIAHHRILGLNPGERIGTHIWDFSTDSKQKQELRDYLAYLIKEQPSPEPYITSNITKDGREVILEVTWDYQHNATGEVIGFISVISDVTAQVQAQQTLRDKEARYRELVDAMSDGVAVYEVVGDGDEFVFKEHNRAGERITGLSRERVIGRPLREAFPGIEAMGLAEVLRQVWRSGEPAHLPVNEYQDLRLTLWLENYVFKLPNGELVAIYADITEHKRSEIALKHEYNRVRLILETTLDGYILADTTGRIVDVNPAYCRLVGHERSELLSMNIRQLEASLSDEEINTRIQTMLAAGSARFETQHRHHDGKDIDLDVNIAIMHEGDSAFVLAFTRDISERKQAEEAIRTINRELEDRVRKRTGELQAVNKELESFAYSVSHDLRAPLRAIDGFSLALAEDYSELLDATAHDYLRRIRNGAQRMGMLIDDMLQLSRVNRGEMLMQEVDLTEIAGTVLEELRAGEPDRQVELTLEPNMRVQGDPRLLRVILDNLLGNAWKFTAREAVSHITFEHKSEQPGVFYISDNGVGFDMRHADKLFGAFQRLHRSIEFPGTGVGLTTVQRIIHRLGGRIWAEAREGEGASFYFTLGPT